MFSMLHGRLPRPSDAATPEAIEALVAEAVRLQVDAGLDLVTDGGVRWADPDVALLEALRDGDTGDDGMLVRAWRATAARPEAAGTTVAATVTGPWTLAAHASGIASETIAPEALAGDLADAMAGELAALAAAGCQLVVVDEPAAATIGGDDAARSAFLDAHERLLAGAPGLHAMLAISGGSAWEAGADTILGAPYRSYLFDLIAGPDNWYLVRATPGDRGVVCAALRVRSRRDQASLLVWAARYAASANGRGIDRVGLANASSLAALDTGGVARALEALSRAARLASMEPEDAIRAGLDPRTFRQPSGRGARRGGLPRG